MKIDGMTFLQGDVGVIMDTWTRQMGYPVLTVTRTSPTTFNIIQKRFLQDPDAEYELVFYKIRLLLFWCICVQYTVENILLLRLI